MRVKSMKRLVFESYEAMSAYAAELVANEVNDNRELVLGLPTGSTPIGMYSCLANTYKNGQVDFSKVVTFNLDEYVGVDRDNRQSYYKFMEQNLYSRVNLNLKNIHIPSGVAKDLEKECRAYDRAIEKQGGIGLMVLGIGPNGHIGFNEPGNSIAAGTHVVNLTPNTIQANARFFESYEQVPKKAITMGVGNILKAKKILMLICGSAKKEIAAKLFSDSVSTQIPASLLLLHPDVTVLMDKECYCE